MDISSSEDVSLTCLQCGGRFKLQIWVIIDISARIDLVASLRKGTLHNLTCPNCDLTMGRGDVPLLIYRPDKNPPLLFSPAQWSTDKQNHEALLALISELRSNLGKAWRNEWLEQGITTISRALLPAALDRDREEIGQLGNRDIDVPPRFQTDWNQTTEAIGRYEASGNLGELEAAIAAWKRILSHPDFAHAPERFQLMALNDAGYDFHVRFKATGNPDDFDQAFNLWNDALKRVPETSIDLPMILDNVGSSLRDRYLRTSQMEDLQEAIKAFQRAVQQTPTSSPELPRYLSNLGNGLSNQYIHVGQIESLQQAIEAYQKALEYAPIDSPYLSGILNNLGNNLNAYYERTGKLEDLKKANEAYKGALRHTLAKAPDLLMYLSNLGNGLRRRYELTGRLEDLDQAIRLHRGVVLRTSEGSQELPSRFNNWGASLYLRYIRTHEIEDLEQTIDAYQMAADRTLPGSPSLPGYLGNLGQSLRVHYDSTKDLEELEQAVEICQYAVELTPKDSPDLPGRLLNLGNTLAIHYLRVGTMEDLEQAIGLFRDAAQLMPLDSPSLPYCLNSLGNILSTRYNHTSRQKDLQNARKAYERACQTGLKIAPEVTLASSRNWGGWAMKRMAWSEAAIAYSYGVQAIGQIYRAQLLHSNRETWLREAPALITNAAYALARADHLQDAIVALEQGRARGLSQTLARDRAELEHIQLKAPEVYNRYHQLTDRLRQLEHQERASNMTFAQNGVTEANASLAEQIRQAREELEQSILQIRGIPGFEEFLSPLTFSHIQSSLKTTPLAYVLSTEAGGLALIVHPGSTNNVTPVWLPSLTEEKVHEKLLGVGTSLDGYIGTYIRWRSNPKDALARTAWFNALDRTTRWLWDSLMGPLVEVLAPASAAAIIPMGLLALLPLHAAWREDSTTPSRRHYALDSLTITYSPNAQALAVAQNISSGAISDALLAVDDPRPVKARPLRHSEHEVRVATFTFPRHKILRHEEAIREAVLAALPEYSVFHFSCHGYANLNDPLTSGLVLSNDEFLTVRDLLDLHLTGIRLAVLSACESGMAGTKLPDEVISLPTGLLQAGVAGVVSSLWSVNESSTMMMLTRFYDLWRGEGVNPPEAVRRAQRWLRDTTDGEKIAYFEAFLSSSGRRLPSDVAQSLYSEILLSDPNIHDFTHPFYWAAFNYTGI